MTEFLEQGHSVAELVERIGADWVSTAALPEERFLIEPVEFVEG